MWKAFAYAGRYGRQPVTAMEQLTRRELLLFIQALNDLVDREGGATGMTEDL